MEKPYPRSLAHVAVSVPDIEAAIDWYQSMLGWTVIMDPKLVKSNEGYGGKRAANLLGEFHEMKVAHLTTGNQIAVEFFEFSATQDSGQPESLHSGFFHICVVDPDVEELAERIDSNGGDHHTEIWRIEEDDERRLLTYCKDPYDNIIEIYSHNHEQMVLSGTVEES